MKYILTLILLINIHAHAQESQNISGNYFQSCNTDSDDNSYEQHLGFFGQNLQWKFVAYEDPNCKMPYLIFKREYKIKNLSRNKIQTLALISTYVSLTDEITSSLNIIKYCGFENWKTNEVRDVTGKKCEDFQQLKLNEKKEFQYNIKNNQLYWNNDKIPYESIRDMLAN